MPCPRGRAPGGASTRPGPADGTGARSWNAFPAARPCCRWPFWYGRDLCGLALGQASRRRWNGSRHTITLPYVERRPEPPDVPLRGQVISLAIAVARQYGLIVGARHLRLRSPDRNLLEYYQRHGFEIVWKGSVPVHCEREIQP